MNESAKEPKQLLRGLTNRHIQMIALGGTIGTGLFYGSAASIKLAGPAITVAYIISGLIIFFIMRMMGEMSVEEPVAGAFSYFAYKYWGEFPGFLTGWNYWFQCVIVNMVELTVVGVYINYWLPNVPHWLSALFVLGIITVANLINVKIYGELEFWFAIVKVLAIIGMIILGGLMICIGFDGTPAIGFSNLWVNGGFFPNGMSGLLQSLVIVTFSFGGVELIAITAGETKDPKRIIPTAINQVIWRIFIFYIMALTVLVTIYPWNQIGMNGSPFVEIFSKAGISFAATVLNIVVLTAAVSVYNSLLYSSARMLFSLSEQGNAPKCFTKLSNNGVPVLAIFASSVLTLFAVGVNYLFPEKAFMYIISIATISIVITWIMIIIVNIKFRNIKKKDSVKLYFKTPFYPYSNYICLAFMFLVFGLMTQIDDMKLAVYILPFWLLLLYVAFRFKKFQQ